MTDEKPCARCGDPTPTRDNVEGSSFWGAIQLQTITTTTRVVRFLATYYRRSPRFGGSPLLTADETEALCDPCWGLLIGRFMQGRSVPAMAGKEGH